MPSMDEIAKYLTGERAQDIMDIAAYGGITHWAIRPNDEEFAGLPEGKTWTIVEGTEPHPIFPFDDEREVEAVHYLDADDLRGAYIKLLDLDQSYVCCEYHDYILHSWLKRTEEDGIETREIDAGTADVIVQVSIFGEVQYG